MTNPTPTPKGCETDDLVAVLRENTWGKNVADTLTRWDRARYEAADLIEALREREEEVEAAHLSLCEAIGIPATALSHIDATAALQRVREAARVDGWNAALTAALAETTATQAEDDTRARIRALALPAPTADGPK